MRRKGSPATQAEIDRQIAIWESATSEERAYATSRYRAIKMIEACRAGAPHQLMSAYAAVAREIEKGISTTRALYRNILRFPEFAREAACLPMRRIQRRARLAETIPGVSEFIRRTLEDRNNLVRNSTLARAVLIKFGLDASHFSALWRYIDTYRKSHASELLAATNPDRARSLLRPAHGSMSAGLEPGNVAEMDGTDCPILVFDTPSGKCTAIGIIDVASGFAAVALGPSESTDLAARAFIKFHDGLGLPRTLRTDHGKGLVSLRMQNFCEQTAITLETPLPYQPIGKASIEAFFWRLGQLVENDEGFCGHSVTQRMQLRGQMSMAGRRGKDDKEIFGVRYEMAELEQRIDRYLAIEADRPRDTRGGRTTNEIIKDWISRGGQRRQISDRAALCVLLAPAGFATVGKRGLQIERKQFIAPELGNVSLIGHRVQFRRMPDVNLIAVFTAERVPRFICVARCAEDMSPEERRASAVQAVSEYGLTTREIRRRKFRSRRLAQRESLADILLRDDRGVESTTSRGGVVHLLNPAIAEVTKAVQAVGTEADAPSEMSAELRERLEADPDLIQKIRAVSPRLRANL